MRLLKNTNDCTGCSACQSVCAKQAIEMKRDRYGFVFPKIDSARCVECGACQSACPVLHAPALSEATSAWAAISGNEAQRLGSTSGGVFSLLAEAVIACGGVVFGAAYNERQQVVHIAVERAEDISRLRGAKYAQSDLQGVFGQAKAALKAGRKVLFSGTPCQIGGLKRCIGKEDENLLTVDLVCHGVPSPKAWEAYVEHRRQADGQAQIASRINLRSKVSGWTNAGYSVQFLYDSGAEYCRRFDGDLYMQAYTNDMFMRPSCLACKFKGIERCSDITLGDYWGIEEQYPDWDDNKGTSLVLVHTEKGRAWWERIAKACRCREVSAPQYTQKNRSIMVSAWTYPDRETVLKRIDAKSFAGVEKRLGQIKSGKTTLYGRIRGKIRRTLKRAVQMTRRSR